ncbi:MAG: DUF2497 domain-containing protein [Rhizomicrobium sp.]|jgi:cell pole-organizing protein PopZ
MSSSPQHEPTMEEILASIRKIISEDSTEAAPAAETKPAPAPTPAFAQAPAPAPAPVEADVLELTQEIHEEAPEPPPAPVLEPAAPLPPPENDVVFETIEEPAVTNEAPLSDHDGIFSDKTRKAMEDTFANIEPEPVEAPRAAAAPVAPIDARTVEAVFERAVREAFDPVVKNWLGTNADAIVERMKPLIREWMDEHFPALLEGAVRNEVARVVKARGTKR